MAATNPDFLRALSRCAWLAQVVQPGPSEHMNSVQRSDHGGQPLVFMRFRPAWTYIEGIRTFCKFFCEATYQESDLAERAQMVMQETLENAVKYSTKGTPGELEIEITSGPESLKIGITSHPAPEHLEKLKRELEFITSLDPEAAYLAAFMRAANEPDAPARLGLARMRYEGRFELYLNEEADGRVRMTAVGKL